MSSNFTCCGCWPAFVQGLKGSSRTGSRTTYRRAKYNEREYSIEFENLIEEEDFYPPAQHAVTDIERDLLSRRKFGELLQHENDIIRQQDAKLREKEENARLEDEAYIHAKKEAARVAKQTMKKQMDDKPKFPNMNRFDSVEFSKWLSEEKIDINSPELDVEDFESFLEKVRAKSAQALEEEGKTNDAHAFEQALSQGLAATKIAGDALNALQPVELHAVGMPSFSPSPSEVYNPFAHTPSGTSRMETSRDDSIIMDIPDVEVKTQKSVIQTSEVPVQSFHMVESPVAVPHEVKPAAVPLVVSVADPVIIPPVLPVEESTPLVDISDGTDALIIISDDSEFVSASDNLAFMPDDIPEPPVSQAEDNLPVTSETIETSIVFSSDDGAKDFETLVTLNSDANEHLNADEIEETSSVKESEDSIPSVPLKMEKECEPNETNVTTSQVCSDSNVKVVDASPFLNGGPPSVLEAQYSVLQDSQGNCSSSGTISTNVLVDEEQLNKKAEMIEINPITIVDNPENIATELNPTVTDGISDPVTNGIDTLVTNGIDSPVTNDIDILVTNGIDTPVTNDIDIPVTNGIDISVTNGIDTPVTNGIDTPITNDTVLTNVVDVQPSKTITPTTIGQKPGVGLNTIDVLDDSLNGDDDDEFGDFDDEFVSGNTNGAFEDYLT